MPSLCCTVSNGRTVDVSCMAVLCYWSVSLSLRLVIHVGHVLFWLICGAGRAPTAAAAQGGWGLSERELPVGRASTRERESSW